MLKLPLLALFLCLAGHGGAQPKDYREPPAPAHTIPPAVNATAYAPDTFAELLVETDAYGFVTRAEVRNTSQPAFAQACVDAVRHWRYAPAREYGHPTPARFIQPIRIAAGRIRVGARSYFPPPAATPSPVTDTPRDR